MFVDPLFHRTQFHSNFLAVRISKIEKLWRRSDNSKNTVISTVSQKPTLFFGSDRILASTSRQTKSRVGHSDSDFSHLNSSLNRQITRPKISRAGHIGRDAKVGDARSNRRSVHILIGRCCCHCRRARARPIAATRRLSS